MTRDDGRKRVVIDYVGPQVDGGRFPIKRAAGETVTSWPMPSADGHDHIRVETALPETGAGRMDRPAMAYEVNDEWSASFPVTELGRYLYTVRGWVDRFGTWQSDLQKKFEAAQDVTIELKVGAGLLRDTARRAELADATKLAAWAELFETPGELDRAVEVALGDELTDVMQRYPDRVVGLDVPHGTGRDRGPAQGGLQHVVRAVSPLVSDVADATHRGGTMSRAPARHVPRLRATAARDRPHGLRRAVPASHPPHRPDPPQGQEQLHHRRCRDDPGSPWAIGSSLGGHKAIHPELGTLDDFKRLIQKAAEHGLEVAMDLAFQCSPDHPYVTEHPEWFRWRPDGTVQYAENPPKKYQDILPLNLRASSGPSLWEELKSIVQYWIDQGIRIFRVDNPHTKPFAFWEWLIGEIRRDHPDVIFLSEAFTRPKVMQRLAKIGFNQSYTYFTWRNTKRELEQYIRELAHTEVGEYMRPNFWPNTPDILPQYLQYGGRPAFIIRLILAATLSASYGIYGPAYELCVNEPSDGKEEYLNSEKYEIKHWDWDARGNLP